jgi:hypothetical protein
MDEWMLECRTHFPETAAVVKEKTLLWILPHAEVEVGASGIERE